LVVEPPSGRLDVRCLAELGGPVVSHPGQCQWRALSGVVAGSRANSTTVFSIARDCQARALFWGKVDAPFWTIGEGSEIIQVLPRT